MYYLRLAMRFSLCLSLFLSFPSWAQNSAQAAVELEKLEATLATKQDALETVTNRLDSYEAKTGDAQEQFAKAQETYEEAQQTIAEARESGDASKIDVATRRLELAERGLESRQGRLERINEKNAELSAEAQQLNNDIAQLRNKITAQQKRVADLKAQETQAAKVAAATPVPTPVPTPRPTEVEPAPIAVEKEVPAAAVAAAAPTLAPTRAPTPAPTAAPKAEQLSPQKRYARAQMKKLNELTKNADKTEERRYEELLLEIDRDEVIELEYLGADQFYAEFPLEEGSHKLTINLKQYKVGIPEEQGSDTFVLIYDVRDRRDPRFVFFNKKLLD